MKKILFLLFITSHLFAQEIECRVTLNTSQLNSRQTTDAQTFSELENAIKTFMNNRQWTNDVYGRNEKIKCDLTINLTSSSRQNVFSGNAQFQVLRPVYGTDYETVIFKYVDRNFDISFAPEERQMVFNEQGYTNNLTSILAIYSLVALAIDYDTFAKHGGQQFIQRAYNVVTLAATQGGGWASSENARRNRYWLVDNLQSQQMMKFREGLYEYHRLILDQFGKDTSGSRAKILSFLELVQNIVTLNQSAVLINTFFDAKAQEFVNIFSQGSAEEKQKAFILLSGLDPDKTEIYRKIING